jgi:hypothetical protein
MSGPKSVHNAQYEWTTNGGRSQGCEMTVDIFIFILGGAVRRRDKYNHYRLLTMNYHLSFLDDDGRVQDVREGVFEADDTAKRWMRIVGEAWARDYECALMEFWGKSVVLLGPQQDFFGKLRNPNGISGMTHHRFKAVVIPPWR